MFQQKFADGSNGDLQGLVFGITIDTGGDQREGNGFAFMLKGQLQRINIAVVQQPGFSRMAAVPDGADCVDDVSGRQFIAAGDYCFPYLAAADAVTSACSLSAPAAAKMEPHTPPPFCNAVLAALTITSTSIVVISLRTICSGMILLSLLI
jgi:hypothetical protein